MYWAACFACSIFGLPNWSGARTVLRGERLGELMNLKKSVDLLTTALFLCASATAIPIPAGAQNTPSITIDAAGTCPPQEELIRLNPSLGDGSAISLQYRMGTPVRNGLRLLRNSSLADSPIQTQPLGFDDEVEVLLGAQVGQSGPALVQKRTGKPICGWLNASDIERFTAPLRLIDIPGFSNEKDRSGQGNRLVARVVVKNRIDRETGYGQRAPLFQEPFEGSTEPTEEQRRGSIGFFEVLSVFEVRHANGSPCRVFREGDCFLRVGATTVGIGNAGMIRTRGWVRGSDVEIWPSALAIYYGPGQEGLKIHVSELSARTGTPWRGVEGRESILAFQPEGKYEEPRDRNIVRFPVIRGTPLIEQPQDQRRNVAGQQAAVSYIYEIVFNGQACIEDSAGGRTGCIPEPQIKDQVARLGQVVRAISKIDVLFVVDATESMGPYVRSVVAAIRRHVAEAAARNEWSLRYSVVFYGDYNRKVDGGLDYYSVPFSGANDVTGLDRVQGLGTFEDENKDIPEAPFAALERAANTAAWDPEAAQRLIIWIADHGNRAPGTYTTAAGQLTEMKAAQSVVDAMRAADARRRANSRGITTKTHFAAIQVQGGATASSQSQLYFRKFRQDAEAIEQLLGEKAFQTIPAPSNANAQQELALLTRTIADQITRNVEAVDETRQAVQGALGGDTSKLQGNLSPAALLAQEYLTQLGFSPQKLQELGRRIQLVRNGFVFQSNRSPNFRYWLGLRRPEFTDVRQKARALCENIGISDRVGYIEEAILALVRAVTFTEMRPGETVRDFYARVLSVPTNHLSLMLDGTPADFMRRWQAMTKHERDDTVIGVCRRAQLLDYVGNGQLVENPDRDIVYDVIRNTTILKPGVTLRDFDWRWITVDARTEWFFIPLDYLP